MIMISYESWNEEIILEYLGGFKVITRVHNKWKEEIGQSQRF